MNTQALWGVQRKWRDEWRWLMNSSGIALFFGKERAAQNFADDRLRHDVTRSTYRVRKVVLEVDDE